LLEVVEDFATLHHREWVARAVEERRERPPVRLVGLPLDLVDLAREVITRSACSFVSFRRPATFR
jgi:hypothetical protein